MRGRVGSGGDDTVGVGGGWWWWWLLAAGELAGDLYRGGWVLTVKRPYSFLL